MKEHPQKFLGAKQTNSKTVIHCQDLWDRSIFGMTDVYNNLPQHAVDASSVKIFQKYLIHIVRTRCKQADLDWPSFFCGRVQG